MPPQPSTFTLKTAFLSSQTRLLSTLPPPPTQWQQNLPPSSEHGDLSASVVDQVLYKLSIVARKHHHEVYSSQTLRHIAEQIDSLYYEAAQGKEGEIGKEIAVLRAGVDLRLKENIDALPESYLRQDGVTEEDLEMYQTLRARLKRSCDVLEGQRGKHAYYERLRGMLKRFENPTESVQPNLVTRDGRLNEELERTKVLAMLLAVEVGKAGLKGRQGEDDEEDEEMEDEGENSRLLDLLAN